MSNQYLKLRRSSVPGRVPTTSSLDFGEIALNTYDGLAFIKKSSSNGEEVIAIGATATVSGSQYFIPVFSGSGVTESTIFQSGSFIAFPNATEPYDPAYPDLLFISGSGIDTYNLISAHSDRDGYVQLNIQNFSLANNASSDIVASANNATENNYYIDMGINGENYANNALVGFANDAYIYSTGNDLLIGNASAGRRVVIFNGGLEAEANAKVFIHEQGTVGINTNLYNAENPPSLFVKAPNSTTFNVIQGQADTDGFTEVSHTNVNAGNSASADFVAYNNIDPVSQSAGYVDMGINSTTYVPSVEYPGTAGDAYVYTDSHHLILGTISQSAEARVTIFAGGANELDYAKLVLYGSNQHVMTGSLNASEGFTGSLYGTASWALNTITASFVATSSWATNALTASSADNLIVRQNLTASNALFSGTVIAQTLFVQYVTASTEFVTGSSKFGSLLTDTHQFTGSVSITGSLTVNGSLNASNITGSLFGTSSWSRNSVTASYVQQAQSASYVLNAVSSSFSTNSATASYVVTSLTSSFVTASNVYGPYGSNSVLTSSYAVTASYVLGGASTINIQDEGSAQGSAGTINFVGAGVTAAVAGGTATITIPGGGSVSQGTGSVALHTQASPATTWSFAHNLNNTYPVLNVWDSNGFMIMPGGVKTITSNSLEIYFDIAQAGYASAVVGGTAVSASFALTASYALNAGSSGPAAPSDYIASGVVTASVANSPNGIFLIKSGSVNMFEISGSGRFTANSSIFIIKNYTTQQPVFTVSESIVKFATQSAPPTGTADPGAFWFTSTDLYIGVN